VHIYKVGMQLYTAEGPAIVRELVASGYEVFLDLKYHDIPSTVAAAVREAARLGVAMLTVHASGGTRMLELAAEAARPAIPNGRPLPAVVSLQPTNSPETRLTSSEPLKILAVTVLTSMQEADLGETGVQGEVVDQVVRLALMALKAGCAGVVSSARETKILRSQVGDDFLLVTPGVRPLGADQGDQVRVVTPADAIAFGATHIVVGRPITGARDPAAAARAIQREIKEAAALL
ncbi:MAG: orotidine-5'-phosphate decarboxylase, partial [Acidobacteria bacterium]|nr:orotidine-5'-phosphate decarboxylase [Acidobacteriota bacterium]